MFIGHFGVGFAAKKATPALSLGLLFLATQFLDLLWPTFLLLNIEHVTISSDGAQTIPLRFTDYPWSHSLLMAMVWAFLFATSYWLFKKNIRNAAILGACVFSHWFLDLLVHYPDLPLGLGNTSKLGLQLWQNQLLENILEAFIFFGGITLYVRATEPKNRKGVFLLWVLIGLLVVSQIANLYSPPPPNVNAVAWGTQGMWLFVLLAFWLDRNRSPKKRSYRIRQHQEKAEAIEA